jgi:quercetin dioxygenase-like cupin family protein
MQFAKRFSFFAALLFAGCTSLNAQGVPERPVVNHAATARFAPVSNFPECATAHLERGDPASGPATFLLRMTAGCEVPWHWHTADESLLMVSGSLSLHSKVERPAAARHSDYVFMPAKHVHAVKCLGADPCELFLVSGGAFDIHYVDKTGNEIPMTEAVEAATPAKKPENEKPQM